GAEEGDFPEAEVGHQVLGPVGAGDVIHAVEAQPRLRDRPGGIDEQGRVGRGDVVRLVARVGAADALVESAQDAAGAGVAVADAAAVGAAGDAVRPVAADAGAAGRAAAAAVVAVRQQAAAAAGAG